MTRPTATTPAILAVAYIGARLFGELVIYQRFIVPQLPHLHSVPVSMWLLAFTPTLIAGMAVAYWIRDMRGLTLASAGATGIDQILGWAFAVTAQPGHLKSTAVEAPAVYWTIHLGMSLLIHFAAFLIAWLLWAALRRSVLRERQASSL